MQDFVFQSPTKIFFGPTQAEAFAGELKQRFNKVLLLTGQGSLERLGIVAKVKEHLVTAGVNFVHATGVEANPLAQTIQRIVVSNAAEKVQAVVALGGGSVMDAGKAIAALLYSGETDIWPYVAGEPKQGGLKGSLPIVAIPTTAATASEVTPYAVISNQETNGKAALAYDFFKPVACWINPAFTTSLPEIVTADGAADILSHVFENYIVGGTAAPLTDRYCEGIITTVLDTLPKLRRNPTSVADRATLLWCSTCALNGLGMVGRKPGPFALHAMEHALSGFKHDLAHGRGLATLFPAYFRWLWDNNRARDRFTTLGQRVFALNDQQTAGLGFIDRFEQWLRDNNLWQSLTRLGFAEGDYQKIADEVFRVNANGEDSLDVCGKFSKVDVIAIFRNTARQN